MVSGGLVTPDPVVGVAGDPPVVPVSVDGLAEGPVDGLVGDPGDGLVEVPGDESGVVPTVFP